MEKILLVESSDLVVLYLQKLIDNKLGIPVVTAKSYKEAQDIIGKETGTDFIAISGLNFPDDQEGKTVDYFLSLSIPVIVLTGNENENVKNNILKKNVFDNLIKTNFEEIDLLVQSIQRVIRNRNIKILIAEASEISRKMLKDLLKSQLFQVFEANNGKKALEILEEQSDIKLVISDYYMPEMNGYEFLGSIRKLYSKEKIIFIAVSTEVESNIISKFLKSGANDFIDKPYNNEEFLCRINSNLDYIEVIEKLNILATKDYMTDLYNRMYFYDMAKKNYSQAVRNSLPIALIMIDIDYFKQVNDTFGHYAGDYYIKQLAAKLHENLKRESDITARFGGDEFCIFTTFNDKENLAKFIDQVREKIQKEIEPFPLSDKGITVSIGISTDKKNNLDEMIQSADKALYEAKKNGRNQVFII